MYNELRRKSQASMSFVSKCALGLSSAFTCFLFQTNDSLMVFKFSGYSELNIMVESKGFFYKNKMGVLKILPIYLAIKNG